MRLAPPATGSTSLVERRDVDEMQQQAGALQVAQEPMAEPGAFGRAFDQARDVGDDEALLRRDPDHAEIRHAAS